MIVCADCNIKMNRMRTGVTVIEMFNRPPEPYRLWQADILQCVRCGHKIVQTGREHYAEHFQEGFAEQLEMARKGEYHLCFERVSDSQAWWMVRDNAN